MSEYIIINTPTDNLESIEKIDSLSANQGRYLNVLLDRTKSDLQRQIDTKITSAKGMIIMWAGNISEIPVGWALYVGTNGTPNLVDRFILGADNTTHKTIGGVKTVTLTVDNLPPHTHSLPSHNHSLPSHNHSLPSHNHSLPSHNHSISNHSHSMTHSHSHTLSAGGSTSGRHTHKPLKYDGGSLAPVIWYSNCYNSSDNHYGLQYFDTPESGTARSNAYWWSRGEDFLESNSGAHSHSISGSISNYSGNTGTSGGGSTGSWSGTSGSWSGTSGNWNGTSGNWNGTSGSTGNAKEFSIIPKYYALCFIMRLY